MLYLKLGGGNALSRIVVGVAYLIQENGKQKHIQIYQDGRGDVLTASSAIDLSNWVCLNASGRLFRRFNSGSPMNYSPSDQMIYIYDRETGEIDETFQTTSDQWQ